jgi:hypothetical protein
MSTGALARSMITLRNHVIPRDSEAELQLVGNKHCYILARIYVFDFGDHVCG